MKIRLRSSVSCLEKMRYVSNVTRNVLLPQCDPSMGSRAYSSSILNGFIGAIGNTPMIKLEKLSKDTGCNILVKCEYMNPGGIAQLRLLFVLSKIVYDSAFCFILSWLGSVKDRAALYLIQEGIKLKKIAHLKQKDAPSPLIVEGTAGNTGIGVAHMCNSLGFQCHIYMPNNQSKEKIESLTALGFFVPFLDCIMVEPELFFAK